LAPRQQYEINRPGIPGSISPLRSAAFYHLPILAAQFVGSLRIDNEGLPGSSGARAGS